MLNYVRAELYKVTHRHYSYLFPAIVLGIILVVLCSMTMENHRDGMLHITFSELLNFLPAVLSMGLYFSFIVGDIVFSDQYKHGTLKNEISFGISRSQVYLGKLITEAIVGVVLVAVMVGFYVLGSAVLYPQDENSLTALAFLGVALAAAVPLYLGAMSFVQLFFFHLKSSAVAAFLPAGFLAITGSVMGMALDYPMGFFSDLSRVAYPLLLTTPFDQMNPYIDGGFVLNAWCIGLGWLLVSTVLGVTLFRKKEIS